jgi:hypothetical protein
MQSTSRQLSDQTRRQNVTPQNLILSGVETASPIAGGLTVSVGLFNEDISRTICGDVSVTVTTDEGNLTSDRNVCVGPGEPKEVEFSFRDIQPRSVVVCAKLTV